METIEKIELYLEGNMPPADITAFEKEIADNAQLREEVDAYRDMIAGVRLSGQNEFVHMVHKWEKELAAADLATENQTEQTSQQAPSTPSLTATPVNRLKWVYRIAAAACVVCVIGFGLLQLTSSPSPEKIFDNTFAPYPTGSIVRGDNDSPLEKAAQLYNKKDYKGALAIYNEVLDTNPDSIVVNLYAGVANIALGKAQEATEQLEKVANSNNQNFSDAGEWYLAILPLKNGNKTEAVERLEKIRNTPGHEFREQAKKLLKQLK